MLSEVSIHHGREDVVVPSHHGNHKVERRKGLAQVRPPKESYEKHPCGPLLPDKQYLPKYPKQHRVSNT